MIFDAQRGIPERIILTQLSGASYLTFGGNVGIINVLLEDYILVGVCEFLNKAPKLSTGGGAEGEKKWSNTRV